MGDSIKNTSFSTTRIVSELETIASTLGNDDSEWIKKAIERLSILQSICRPSLVVNKAETYSASVTTDNEGYEKTFFNVLLPFKDALDFAKNKYEKLGLNIRKIELKRDDEIQEYEPYADNDIRFKRPREVNIGI